MSKISEMPDGVELQPDDLLTVVRGGLNYRLRAANDSGYLTVEDNADNTPILVAAQWEVLVASGAVFQGGLGILQGPTDVSLAYQPVVNAPHALLARASLSGRKTAGGGVNAFQFAFFLNGAAHFTHQEMDLSTGDGDRGTTLIVPWTPQVGDVLDIRVRSDGTDDFTLNDIQWVVH